METIEDLDLFDMISYILSPISNDQGMHELLAHIASHHNLSPQLIHYFLFLYPVESSNLFCRTLIPPLNCVEAMFSDHNYSAKCKKM